MYTSTSPHLSRSGWTTFVNRPQLLGNPDPAVAFPITLFICTLVSKILTFNKKATINLSKCLLGFK